MIEDESEGPGGRFRVRLEMDDYPYDTESPREYDGRVAVIVAPVVLAGPVEDTSVRDALTESWGHQWSLGTVARWLRVVRGATVVLPLYQVGDGGLSCGAEGDTGGLGLVFDTPQSRAELGAAATAEDVRRALVAEVDEYSSWATGDVWGYVVERLTAEDDGDDEWEHEDSCWGLIGRSWAEQSAREALAAAATAPLEHAEAVYPAVRLRERVAALAGTWERAAAELVTDEDNDGTEDEVNDECGTVYAECATALREALEMAS